MLNKIAFIYEEANDQSNTFTPYHIRYDCVIKYGTNCKPYRFDYQCNPDHMTPNIKDVMYALLSDTASYDGADNIFDFCDEFGYDCIDNYDKAIEIYNACKETSIAIHNMFTDDELDELSEELNEW